MQRRLLTLIVVLLVVTVGGVAPMVDARVILNGSYAFTTARTCTVASNPFTNDASGKPTIITTTPTLTFLFRQEAVDSGIITFNADGTGASTSRSSTMNITATTGSILSVSENSNTFTYTVNADGTVDLDVGVVSFTTVLGGGTNNSGTASAREAQLQIGNGGNSLVSAPRNDIEQETVIINLAPPNGSGSITQYRICNRSSKLVRN